MSALLLQTLEAWLVFLARYALLAAAACALLWIWSPALRHAARARTRQMLAELLTSAASGAVFVSAMLLLLLAARAGHTRIYAEPLRHGMTWLVASVGGMVLIHDAYFYWTHRWMHALRPLRRAHRFHHTFREPTPWSAFSFHWGEALISAGVLPLVVFAIPVHPLAILAFTTLMTAQSVAIHCGVDVPGAERKRPWLMGPRAHGAHHAGARGNYGLYFTFWDIAMGTYVERPAAEAPQSSAHPAARSSGSVCSP